MLRQKKTIHCALLVLVLWVSALLLFYSDCSNAAGVTTVHQMNDDGYVGVPIPFGFPYYGKVFTYSWMFDNGVVGFMDPGLGYNGPQNWNSQPINQVGPNFSYMIAPLWADIYPAGGSSYTTTANATSLTYNWNNVAEYYSGGSRRNTFGLEIRQDGYFGATYNAINTQLTNVSIGYTGDVTKGEVNQLQYYNYGTTVNNLQNWVGNAQPVDPCVTNPLSSTSCAGYQEAYLQQQCSANPLFSPSCSGYGQAYFNYMCSTDPLYDMTCPGYAVAYHDYQCGIDPLYATDCNGYANAYHNQQCSLNPLYATNCSGYQQAYHNLQCEANPLYATDCAGYEQAYYDFQCEANTLYHYGCPGYTVAYQNYLSEQACKANPQSSPSCPNYVEPKQTSSVVAVATEVTVSETGKLTDPTTVSVVEPVVESVIKPTNVLSNSVVPASVPVQSPVSVVSIQPVETKKEDSKKEESKKEETKKEETQSSSKQETKSESKSDKKESTAPSKREAMVEAAKKKEIEAAKNLANTMGEAKTMEAQSIAQNATLATMGYVQGFDSYMGTIRDAQFYKPYDLYKNQRTIDNKKSLMRLWGPSDSKHKELINQQYRN